MSDTPFIVVIPARLQSSRLPEKALADLAGKPMVVRVAERAQQSAASRIIVATDHVRIAEACQAAGVDVVMTREDHPSGTDRLAEVVQCCDLPDEAIIVNVQGDEPLIDPALIDLAARLVAQGSAPVATLAHPIHDAADMHNPNVVKVVCDAQGHAMYFSRAPIPFARDAFAQDQNTLPSALPVMRHIGIYAYRAGFLRQYCSLTPSLLEQFEALEQLRVLWHGYAIAVACVDHPPAAGVDTEQDLARVRALFSED